MENIQSNIFQQLGLKWAGDIENRACTIGAVQAAVRDFLNHPHMNRDVMNWFRITRDEWNTKRDGISIFTSDAPEYIKLWVELFSFQEDLLSEEFVQAEIDFIDRVSQATLFWGLIYGNNNQKNTQIIAGRMIERVYLHAQANGLAVHPISYPTEMPKQKAHLKKVFNLKEQEEPLFLFRLGKGVYLERSVRRDLKTVLI